jgi:hypothetical protein
MPALEHVIYASVATEQFTAAELSALLANARESNQRAGLTGMLLHADVDGGFFQVLEGTADAIDTLMLRLKGDPRHTHITTLIREPLAERSFAEWTMGFSSVSPEKLRAVTGLNDFFQTGSCFTQLDAGRAKKLLAAFSEGRWRPKHLGVVA